MNDTRSNPTPRPPAEPHPLRGQPVVVTGGAGFIGSELTAQLCDLGASVTVVDNLVNGKRENLPRMPEPRLRFAQVDLRDDAAVRPLVRGARVVFHLACLGVRHSIHSPRENHEVNATATLELLRMSREGGAARFVYVSSSEVYGTARTVPMTEDHPTFPMTVYGASKLAGECYARAYHRTYDYPTVVVRPFNSYGPRSHHEGDSGEVIPKFMLRAMAGRPMVVFGDGTQTRDFTYVADTARGIIQAGCSGRAVGETVNLGFGSEIQVLRLAEEVRRVVGRPDATIGHDVQRPGDVLRLYADTTKAAALLGYSPSVPLREGLTRLRDWYRSLERSPEQLLEGERVRNWEAAPAVGRAAGVGA